MEPNSKIAELLVRKQLVANTQQANTLVWVAVVILLAFIMYILFGGSSTEVVPSPNNLPADDPVSNIPI